MQRSIAVSALALLSVFAGAGVFTSSAHGAELRTLTNDGRQLDYLLVLPAGFDSARAYPVLLALPPGNQTRELAQTALDRYWEAEATTRGWVVIAPIAHNQRSFHSGLERAVPFLLDEVQRSVVFEGGKAHLAGVSNGGKSAFRIATEYPDRFQSLTVLPGFPPDDRATLGLRSLNKLPGGVAMYVGDADSKWITPMRETKQRLEAYGIPATLELWPASEHVVNIKSVELFDMLETKRARPAEAVQTTTSISGEVPGTTPIVPGSAGSNAPPSAPAVEPVPGSGSSSVPSTPTSEPAPLPRPILSPNPMPAPAPTPVPPPVAAPEPAPTAAPAPAPALISTTPIEQRRAEIDIGTVLDDFHDAAAKADFDRYFAHYAPEAVFLGTDATERWTLDEFKTFAKPHFDSGKGWAYRSTRRSVTLSPVATPGAQVAWFEELLAHDKYGVCRGSGVLRRVGGNGGPGTWKVAQYNLSFPIPNDLAEGITRQIIEHGTTEPRP
ncbi:MAG: nuclear transport factor 2 family protein [Phycisphaerales bacterium]